MATKKVGKVCSYCGQAAPLTKEHVWSDVLISEFRDIAPITFDYARQKAYKAEPTIKDTCDTCNNKLLSRADQAIAQFARKHLLDPISIGAEIDLTDCGLARWVMKTAYNLERTQGRANEIWQRHIPFMLGKETSACDVDWYFGPWYELRPEALREMMGIPHVLDARGISFEHLDQSGPGAISSAVELGWALKVGFGVFLLVTWPREHNELIRSQTSEQIRSYGWLPGGEKQAVKLSPFNLLTCTTYWWLSHPNDVPRVPRSGR